MRRLLQNLAKALLVLLALLLVLAAPFAPRSAAISAAYAAKVACSAVYVEGREPADVLATDLWFVPWVSVTFDRAARTATAHVGPLERKAVHREGLGCALVLPDGPDEAALRRISLPPRDPEAEAAMAARPWPLGDAGIDPGAAALAEGIDARRLEAALDEAFREPDPGKPSIRTRAVVVLHRGRIVAERYGAGFGPGTPLIGWSMSKSILSALVGIRTGEGKLRKEQAGLLPEWRAPGDPRAAITLDQMLRMSSGLAFDERYHVPWSDADTMLFAAPDAAGYAAARPAAGAPDAEWTYSSGTSNMLSRVLRASFGGDEEAYLRYPRERLFERIGMRSALVETDPAGTFVLSSFTYACARDWARFGLLYLEDGVFAGERILPEGWVAYTRTPAEKAPRGKYGAHFWLNAGTPGKPEERPKPRAPVDTFTAEGFQCQAVVIVPSRRLVIVRLGLTMPPADVDLGRLVERVSEALPPAKP